MAARCIGNLYIRLLAHIRYLQEENLSLMVGSQFGMKTKSVFKSLQKNTSMYTPESLEHLKTAVSLTVNNNTQGNPSTRGNFNFRGRVMCRGAGRGFGGYQNHNIPTS